MAALKYTNDVGLKTIAIVCDQESSQTRLRRELKVTANNPLIHHPATGEPVFIMPDPVHLLKSIRNNLMNHPIQVSTMAFVSDSFMTIILSSICVTYSSTHSSYFVARTHSRPAFLVYDVHCVAPFHLYRQFLKPGLLGFCETDLFGEDSFSLQTNSERADWSHITKMVSMESRSCYRVAWKLKPSDIHLSSTGKMSVKPAARVLSRSCAICELYARIHYLLLGEWVTRD